MDLFVFIRHTDPTKVRIGERDLAKREVKLLKMTGGRTVPLDPPATTSPKDSGDSIDKLFDDADQEDSVERGDDVLEETIAKDASEVVAEKTKKKQKRKVAGDASGSTHPPKKLRDDYQSLLPNTSGKSLAALRGMILKGFSIPSGVTEPLIAASLAPISDVGPLESMPGPNLRTRPPHVRYVVSSDGSHHSGSYSEATSFVRSLATDAPVVTLVVTTTVVADIAAFPDSKARDASKDHENIGDSAFAGGANTNAASISKLNKPFTSSDSFYASQCLDTETMHRIYVPKWKVTNDSILEDPYVCRDLTDRLAPPALFAQLRTMDYDQLYFDFNVGAARHVCLGAEVKIRTEHILERKGELEDKCTTVLLSERDAKITHLKSLLSLKEFEAAEAIRLCSKLTTVETANAAKDSELRDLKDKNFKSSLESAFELFNVRLKATHDEQAKVLGTRFTELDAQLLEMAAHLDEEFYPCFLTAISGQRTAIGCAVNKGIQDGLRAVIDHGKAGRDLSIVEGYDPFAKVKYIEVLNALRAVDFPLLSELKSKKDASIVDLMDSLRLEGLLAEILEAENLQPSPDQLRLPIHRPEDNLVLGETSLSFSLQVVHSRVQMSLIGEASTSAALVTVEPVTTLSTTFASSNVVPLLLTSNDQALGVEPHDVEPPIVSFEKEELVTSLE
nr:hypothetical protein [Tanacetum cinerariifolium]